MQKALIAGLLASVSLSAMATETIVFGTEASYAPFEFIGSDNKIQGFDVELAQAICHQIDADCQFHNQSFDSLIASLKFRRIDAAMASMDVTPERQKQVLFTDTYYLNSALFVAEKNKFKDIASLKTKRIGVQNGTTHQKYLNDKHHQLTTVPYDSYQNAIIDLKNGRIDAVFGDTAVGTEAIKHQPGLAPVGDKIQDKDYFSTGVAIAVRPSNTSLQQKLNVGLKKVKDNGTYQKIYQKWFQK